MWARGQRLPSDHAARRCALGWFNDQIICAPTWTPRLGWLAFLKKKTKNACNPADKRVYIVSFSSLNFVNLSPLIEMYYHSTSCYFVYSYDRFDKRISLLIVFLCSKSHMSCNFTADILRILISLAKASILFVHDFTPVSYFVPRWLLIAFSQSYKRKSNTQNKRCEQMRVISQWLKYHYTYIH